MWRAPYDRSKPNLIDEETLDSLREYVINQSPGIYYKQIQIYPSILVELNYSDDKILTEKKIHGGSDSFYPKTKSDLDSLGYSWYLEDWNYGLNNMNAREPLSMDSFSKILDQCFEKIKANTVHYHGIMCTHKQPEAGLDAPLWFMHFCDVLIINVAINEGKQHPSLFLSSSQLSKIPNDFSDSLFVPMVDNDKAFSPTEKEFVLDNADLFFYSFGHWWNDKQIPIRCLCPNLLSLRRSNEKLESNIFRKHQLGKWNELYRRAQMDMIRKIMFLD